MISLSPAAPPGVVTSEGLAADLCCFPTLDQYFSLVRSFKDDGFEMCVDLCGVDYLEHFDRWLQLFEMTAREIFAGDIADAFIIRARRIADSFEMGVASVRGEIAAPRHSV